MLIPLLTLVSLNICSLLLMSLDGNSIMLLKMLLGASEVKGRPNC